MSRMTPQTSDLRVTRSEPLIPPDELIAEFPITPAIEELVIDARATISDILRGEDSRMLVIAGPCSIHDEDAALEYAARLKRLADQVADEVFIVMRVYFEKPRTTVGWKGLIYDPHLDGSFDITEGLRRARRLLIEIGEIGLPAGTEFLDPIVPQYFADLTAWAAIGARTTESQTHRQMASGLSMPVGFKNGTGGDSQIAVDAMMSARAPHAFLGSDLPGHTAVIHTTGNPDSHLILRGGKDGPNFGAAEIAQTRALLTKAGLGPQLLVDCSHANSNKDHARQGMVLRDLLAQRAAGDTDIVGCMLESHLYPGNQKLGADPSSLEYGVSITDACVGWDETETLLTEVRDALPGSAEFATPAR